MKQFALTLIFSSIIYSVSHSQSMTSIDFSPWVTNSLYDTLRWNGPTDTNEVYVCVLEGNNHRNGYPGIINTFNYSYQESWFQTWWDDAGVSSSTSYTPTGLSVWSGGVDTILFCFSRQVEGDSNFLYFHQVDFSVTQVTIQAYNCGVPLNHNLVELNQSSGSPSFVRTATEAVFSMSPGANRRHLIRFNQDFDFVRVIENNSADLLNLGFMGYGNFNQGTCALCNCAFNPVLDAEVGKLTLQEISNQAFLQWNPLPHTQQNWVERLISEDAWERLTMIEADSSHQQALSFLDTSPNPGNNYYRIRYVDINGQESFSSTAKLYLGIEKGITVFPNPVEQKELFIQFDHPIQQYEAYQILCIDQQGRSFHPTYSREGSNQFKLELGELAAGLYFISIQDDEGQLFSHKFLI